VLGGRDDARAEPAEQLLLGPRRVIAGAPAARAGAGNGTGPTAKR
jgi:hypothetical protein